MRMYELRDKKKKMGEQEHVRKWKECVAQGGCQTRSLVAHTPPRFRGYCTHCLTLYAHGIALDPPPLDGEI